MKNTTSSATLRALRLTIDKQERIRFGHVTERVHAAFELADRLQGLTDDELRAVIAQSGDPEQGRRMIRDALDVARGRLVADAILTAAHRHGTGHLTFGSFVRRGRGIRAAETRERRSRE